MLLSFFVNIASYQVLYYLLALVALAACARSDEDIERLADQRIATALASTPTVSLIPTATPQPTSTPMTLPPVQTAPVPTPRPFPAEPTPQPTATPIVLPPPTLRPTPTPQPIPTPLPTATPLLLPPPSTPQATPTPDPTATPQPTATPIPTPTPVSLLATIQIVPQASGPAVSTLPGGLTLTIDPGKPLAGRDISFSLAGLDPWQAVTVEFRDPRGTPAEWVTEQEFHFASTDGAPVTNRTLYADEEGSMSWLRIGTLDNEGVWSVRLTMNAGTVSVDYPVSQLQLPVRGG